MSVLVSSGPDQIIWEPSLDVARLFVEQVRVLERLTGTPSGVTAIQSDEIIIEPGYLGPFVSKCKLLLEETNNGALFQLLAGGVSVLEALNNRITSPGGTSYDVLSPREAWHSQDPLAGPMLVRSPNQPLYQTEPVGSGHDQTD